MPSTVKFWLDRVFAAVLMTMLMTSGGARAGGELFDGCLDARGQPIAAIVDDTLPQVALAAQSGGRIELRHNPARLPELSHRVRMFYFAHECARIALGHPLAERSAERARQADCWALATLERSGEMAAPDARRELETALMVEDAQWAAIPGPRRVIDLAACSVKGGLRLPSSAPPSEAQMRVDRCVQGCGDRLWQCQNRCDGETCRGRCLAAYGVCEKACGAP